MFDLKNKFDNGPCHFNCWLFKTGIKGKNRSSLKYHDLQSAFRPVDQYHAIPIPVLGDIPYISAKDFSNVQEKEEVFDDDALHPFYQMELMDRFRYFSSSKSSAELLKTGLKWKNLLPDSARLIFYLNKHQEQV